MKVVNLHIKNFKIKKKVKLIINDEYIKCEILSKL